MIQFFTLQKKFLVLVGCWVLLLLGCRTPETHRLEADETAYQIIEEAQAQALGQPQPFTIKSARNTLRERLLLNQHLPYSDPASLGSDHVERIPEWPDKTYEATTATNTHMAVSNLTIRLSLVQSLEIAARNSREYQSEKEDVFQSALRLDLEAEAFRTSWSGVLDLLFSSDEEGDDPVRGIEHTMGLGLNRKFKTGESIAVNLGLDLVNLLTQDSGSALGIIADATLSIPLLRGSSRFVVTEPLTQAQRNVIYSIYGFERFKKRFSVQVASDYLGVLRQLDQLENAEENYRRLILSTRRARRLADAGQLPEIQVDQARQDELRARNRWISAQSSYEASLDRFKLQLGLPPDARIDLDPNELDALAERARTLLKDPETPPLEDHESVAADAPVTLSPPDPEQGGPLEIPPREAIRTALKNRLDLRVQNGRVFDAQRDVVVAADQLRADASLLGRVQAGESRSLGSVDQGDGRLHFGDGRYSAQLAIDIPFERADERALYRNSLIGFEAAVRSVQALEDQVKIDVRTALRDLLESRETAKIQAQAVTVAKRRLDSTSMFLEAGRAQIRDVLEAEESLVSAQNALSTALVNYRVNELRIQRDMGTLKINEQGLWKEVSPRLEPQHENE